MDLLGKSLPQIAPSPCLAGRKVQSRSKTFVSPSIFVFPLLPLGSISIWERGVRGGGGGLFNLFFPPMPLCHASSREWGRVVDITGWACPTHPTFYPPALLLCIRKKTVFPISQKQKRGSRFLLARTNVRTPVFPPISASFNSISNPFSPPPLLS